MNFNKKFWLANAVFFALFIADRILKIYFQTDAGASRIFIYDFLRFNFEKNYGVAFGMELPQFFIMPAVGIVIFGIVYLLAGFYARKNFFLYSVFLAVFTGAFSNFSDRLKYGYVIDYIDVPFFTVFNISDILITGGVCVLILKTILEKKKQ